MDTFQSLFNIATETIFVFTAKFLGRFLYFPIHPYWSVVKTCRLLKDHRLSDVALVAFSYLFLVIALGATGKKVLTFGNDSLGEGVERIWSLNKTQVEVPYLILFVLGSAVMTIGGGYIFRKILAIDKSNRKFFLEVYNVFISFTVLWFVTLAIVSEYVVQRYKALDRPLEVVQVKRAVEGSGQVKHAIEAFLAKWGLSDISEMSTSPALYVIIFVSGYFGLIMLRSWSVRHGILKIVKGGDAQRHLGRWVIMLSTALTAFLVIVIPGLYLALLSASLFASAASPSPPVTFSAQCFSTDPKSDPKLRVNLIVRNNTDEHTFIPQFYLDLGRGPPISVDQNDIFWMSRKGLYLDPNETRYYRLELTPIKPAQFPLVSSCHVVTEKPTTTATAKSEGDTYSASMKSNAVISANPNNTK